MNTSPQGGNAPDSAEKNGGKSVPSSPAKNIFEYTLAPLIEHGRKCLVCSDVGGMEAVFLESVEFYYCGTPWQRIIRKSDDIFALVENEIFKWPAPERIMVARFRLRINGEHRARALSVRPSIRPAGTSDRVRLVIEDWLMKRGFVKVQNDDAKSVE